MKARTALTISLFLAVITLLTHILFMTQITHMVSQSTGGKLKSWYDLLTFNIEGGGFRSIGDFEIIVLIALVIFLGIAILKTKERTPPPPPPIPAT